MSIVVIAISLTLFVYWFRYTCLLILSAKTSRDYAHQVATANQLRFLETRDQLLADPPPESLDGLHEALRRDYLLLTYLMRYAAGRQDPGHSLEKKILTVDYYLLMVWYVLMRRLSVERSRQALLEVASIVHYLANAMGERLSFSARV
ncbi:MAG TPA: hypothetical protein VE621_00895 [Bryobacteraceae bacterium]|nr:hypothetical protein [Bryobacteraceae bacterium]